MTQRPMSELIAEYRETLRKVRAAFRRTTLMRDRIILAGMIHDLSYTIRYLQARYGSNRKLVGRRLSNKLAKQVRELAQELEALGICREDARTIAVEWAISRLR